MVSMVSLGTRGVEICNEGGDTFIYTRLIMTKIETRKPASTQNTEREIGRDDTKLTKAWCGRKRVPSLIADHSHG